MRRTVQQYETGGRRRAAHRGPGRAEALRPPRGQAGRAGGGVRRTIRAAVEARTDPDLLIIARTDAIAVTGFDDALARAAAAARAGADILFVEAPTSEAEIEALPRRLDRPLLFNYAPSGRSPLPPFARLRALGYAIVIVPVDLLFVATRAMQRALAELRDRDATLRDPERLVSFQEFCDLIGLPEQLGLGQRY